MLLHGASSNLLEFESSIAPLLAARYRVVTIDRPGLGYSDRSASHWPSPRDQAAKVQALLEYLAVDAPILIGHSWSGALVMSHLLDHPGYAQMAVLIAPATHSWGGPPATYNRISRIPAIGWLFRWTLVLPIGNLVLNHGLRSVFYRGEVPDGYRRQAGIDLVLRPRSWHANADDLCLLDDFLRTQERRYPEVKVPVLAITGARDKIVLNDIHVGGLKGALTELRVVEMAETGHSPHQSHPQRTVEEIWKFVENNRVTTSSDVIEDDRMGKYGEGIL